MYVGSPSLYSTPVAFAWNPDRRRVPQSVSDAVDAAMALSLGDGTWDAAVAAFVPARDDATKCPGAAVPAAASGGSVAPLGVADLSGIFVLQGIGIALGCAMSALSRRARRHVAEVEAASQRASESHGGLLSPSGCAAADGAEGGSAVVGSPRIPATLTEDADR